VRIGSIALLDQGQSLRRAFAADCPVNLEEAIMPTDTIILLVFVGAAFAVFAAAVAWADLSTRNLPKR
jgi:hypothetical protein